MYLCCHYFLFLSQAIRNYGPVILSSLFAVFISYFLGGMNLRMTAIIAIIRTLQEEATYDANYLLAGLGFATPLFVSPMKC